MGLRSGKGNGRGLILTARQGPLREQVRRTLRRAGVAATTLWAAYASTPKVNLEKATEYVESNGVVCSLLVAQCCTLPICLGLNDTCAAMDQMKLLAGFWV